MEYEVEGRIKHQEFYVLTIENVGKIYSDHCVSGDIFVSWI